MFCDRVTTLDQLTLPGAGSFALSAGYSDNFPVPIAFSRSMRSLHADGRSRRAICFLLLPAVVLAAWTAWFLGAHVSRYEITDRARLESDEDVHVLQAALAGRVISSGLAVGREVKAGDLVLAIDSGPQQLQMQQSKARLAALELQMAALRASIAAQQRDLHKNESDREAVIQDLRSKLQDLQGDQLRTVKTLERLAFEITRCRILAPVTGKFGEVASKRLGGYVSNGEKLGTIVPARKIRLIAEFPSAAALGRIRPGQPAEWRMQCSPRILNQSHVTSIDSEVHDGTVRVEIAVDWRNVLCDSARMAKVEVQVESVSPATLLLRAAGHTQ